MRRLVAAICGLIMAVTVLAASPAQADPWFSDYTHHNCPNGITLNLGGGEGWRAYMREAARDWNYWIAPRYAHAPYITRINYVGGWDRHVAFYPCMIDMDEWPSADWWGAASVSRSNGHIYGAAIYLYTDAWYESATWFNRKYIVVHELWHTMGLGHNPYCNSVMSYCYQTHAMNGRDNDTFWRMYSHRH